MAAEKHSSIPITINGAGIAGLTAALCLSAAGFRIDIHEKVEGFETIGAGLQITPNAFRVLESLKVGRQVRKAATIPEFISIRKASNNKEITRVPLGLKATKRYGQPYAVIHRADLQEILFQKCMEHSLINIDFGSELVDFAVHDNGITTAIFQEERIQEDKAKAVIIADGIHSKLRTKVMELEPPSFKNKIAWRALIHADQVPSTISMENTTLWLGKHAHAVAYPVREGQMLNVVAVTKADDAREIESENKELVANRFKKWSSEFQALFETNARWSGWPIYEADPHPKMAEGPVAIIGDASHAMMPFAAQGAAMAIEDASILAKFMRLEKTPELAFAKFEKERMDRILQVMAFSRHNGKIYHMSGPTALARNLAMRLSSPSKLLSRQDWIYNWRP